LDQTSLDQTAPSGSHRAELPTALRDALRARLAGELGLPLLPDTAARVMAECRNERCDLKALADLIERDPSLAAHILRVANSAGFAPRMPILSLQQAIGRVGLGTVSDVVLAVAMRERIFAVPGYQERLRVLWRHSVATACYAKEISQLLRGDLESAFLCGLLHDVGMAITLQVVCDLEREGAVPRVSGAVMEAAMLEFHCEFGARIAQKWQLGPWLDAVIRHHHEPAGARFRPDEIAVIALADALAYWAVEKERREEDFVPEPRFAGLRLHEGGLRTLLAKRERVLQMVEALT
jgi:putative nucleotidyltransferase with HDIG domain